MGPPCQGLDRGLGHRARKADRPNLGIVLDSFHVCVRGNPIEPIAAIPARKDRARAGRRRAGAADGPAVAEPALPLLSRPGRLSDRRLSRRRRARGLSRPGFARDFQRPVSRRLRRRDRARRHALAARARRGGERRAGRARRAAAPRLAAAAAGARSRGRRIPRIRRVSDADARGSSQLFEGLGFARAGRHRSQGRRSLPPGRNQLRRQSRSRRLSRMPFNCCMAPRSARWRCRSTASRKALERARAMDCARLCRPHRPGRDADPGGRRASRAA